MAANIRDIAAVCSVSVATVSRALNNRAEVHPETRDKILRAAQEHGYRPFPNSELLSRQREASLAVFLPNDSASALDNPFCTLALSAVVDEMEQNHGAVTLPSRVALEELRALPLSLSALRGVEGVLILFRQLSEAECEGLVKAGLPYLVVGHRPPLAGASHIRFDIEAGAAMAARHLAELGHTSIGYWGWRIEESIQGFRRGLRECNVPTREDWVITPCRKFARINWDEAFDWGRLRAPDRPTAFFCHNDLVAAQLIARVRAMGLRAPEDVSVVGFDDLPMAVTHNPPLTTVCQPVYDMARRGVIGLLEILRGKRKALRETVAPELIVRGSTTAPAAG